MPPKATASTEVLTINGLKPAPVEAGNESVVAAILPKEGQTVTLEQVREWAAKNLSNYASKIGRASCRERV